MAFNVLDQDLIEGSLIYHENVGNLDCVVDNTFEIQGGAAPQPPPRRATTVGQHPSAASMQHQQQQQPGSRKSSAEQDQPAVRHIPIVVEGR